MLVASQEPNSSQEPKEASAVSSIGWALGPAIPPVVDLVAHQQTSDSEAQIYIYIHSLASQPIQLEWIL